MNKWEKQEIQSAYIADDNLCSVVVNGEVEVFDSLDRAEEFLEFLKNLD
ncbi:MAG: hypothetical protein KME52_27905 [Desmonostoc geniculatum HA4340-LM1]|jgi:hypothetical protein|nr:hypothetical protein [Desmonostoc geniculatum HA4340-LM1]